MIEIYQRYRDTTKYSTAIKGDTISFWSLYEIAQVHMLEQATDFRLWDREFRESKSAERHYSISSIVPRFLLVPMTLVGRRAEARPARTLLASIVAQVQVQAL